MSQEQAMKIIKKLDEIIKEEGGYLEFFEFTSGIDELIKNEIIIDNK